jgi:tRNA threonylcarbamoyl adenosine modification protein YeaZ
MEGTEKISLSIESSALPYGVVLSSSGEVLFDSTQHPDLQELKDVPALVKYALETTGRKAADLERIAINIGPGGTSAIRAGVAFANSLAYSLKIPVIGVNTFELLGAPATAQYGCPTLVTIKSVRGHAYVGWYADGAVQQTLYGPLEAMVRKAVGEHTTWAVAGAHREQLIALFPEFTVHDTGKKFGLATDLVPMLPQLTNRELRFPNFVVPITEQSVIFKGSE